VNSSDTALVYYLPVGDAAQPAHASHAAGPATARPMLEWNGIDAIEILLVMRIGAFRKK